MFTIDFQTTRLLNDTDFRRLCFFLSKRTEYRNNNVTITPWILKYYLRKRGFIMSRQEEKYNAVLWPSMMETRPRVMHTITFSPGFNERELRFWVNCFEMFGIVLAEKKKQKWVFILKHADVAEKLRRIPRPKMEFYDGQYFCTVILPYKTKKNLTLRKRCNAESNVMYNYYF